MDLETGTEEANAKRLTANLTDEERLKWQAGDPIGWTNESLTLVRLYAYNTGSLASFPTITWRKLVRLSDRGWLRPGSG